MSAIGLEGFGRKFAESDDPWATFSSRDEAVKRGAIVRALGARPHARILELASGNGSNSAALARRTLRLDATEGTAQGTRLTARALAPFARAAARQLVLPARLPRSAYDAIVVAELLYYLPPNAMRQVARDVANALRPGGVLVLAHHRIDFYDFAQSAANIHARFLAATGRSWRVRRVRATRRWAVIAVA